jgi:hypothetical protein
MISSVIRRQVIASSARRTGVVGVGVGDASVKALVASRPNHPLFSTKSSAAPKSTKKSAPKAPVAAPPTPATPPPKKASSAPPSPPTTTLASRLSGLCEDLPHMDVVKYAHKNRTWTVQHVHYYSEALAIGLLENGFRTGDVVLSYLPSHISEQVRTS